jgi:hypothetical protein
LAIDAFIRESITHRPLARDLIADGTHEQKKHTNDLDCSWREVGVPWSNVQLSQTIAASTAAFQAQRGILRAHHTGSHVSALSRGAYTLCCNGISAAFLELQPSFSCSSSFGFSFFPPVLLVPAKPSIISAICTAFVRFASSSAGSVSVSSPPNSQSSCKSRMRVLRSCVVLIYACTLVPQISFPPPNTKKANSTNLPIPRFVPALLIPSAHSYSNP